MPDEKAQVPQQDKGQVQGEQSVQPQDLGDVIFSIPDDTVFRVGDRDISAKDIKEGWMRQRDYTQKTQKLAEERRELEKMRNLMNDVMRRSLSYQQPEAPRPYTSPAYQASGYEYGGSNSEQDRLRELETGQWELRFQMQLQDIARLYPHLDQRAILQEAYNSGITDLYKVARMQHADYLEQQWQNRENEFQSRLEAATKAASMEAANRREQGQRVVIEPLKSSTGAPPPERARSLSEIVSRNADKLWVSEE